jgi:hypothetical protein
MNDRIHELGKQAAAETSKEVVYLNNIHEWQLVFEQKFAELIVRECMDMVIAHEDDAPKEFHKLWSHMKQHFRVEE